MLVKMLTTQFYVGYGRLNVGDLVDVTEAEAERWGDIGLSKKAPKGEAADYEEEQQRLKEEADAAAEAADRAVEEAELARMAIGQQQSQEAARRRAQRTPLTDSSERRRAPEPAPSSHRGEKADK